MREIPYLDLESTPASWAMDGRKLIFGNSRELAH